MDPHEDVLTLQETALSCFYSGEILSMKSSAGIEDLIKSKGSPEMIILDSTFVASFDHQHFSIPIIATSLTTEENLMDRYPSVTAIIDKPISTTSFSYLVKSLTQLPHREPTHVPIKVQALLRLGVGHFDLYLKLSETNYVKILHKGEAFFEADGKKLTDKGIFELYVRFEDSKDFLTILENALTGSSGDSLEDVTLTIENLEAFEKIAKAMNWAPNVLLSAQKNVSHAVKILSKNQSVLAVLKKKLSGPSSEYSRHIGLLTYLVCAVSSQVGFVGESGQIKLALAALLHDVGVDEDYYQDIKSWNKRAADASDKSPETIKYRLHPFEASKIVRTLDSISPDVEQIILQHHEEKYGSGFPRGLDSGRIGHLPALFIIVEDLVEFIDNGENIETSITDFITWGSAWYDTGHFKKIFQSFIEKLKA